MANDERRTQTFIREVDEELRREQLKQLWDRFGWLFIGVCVLIVAITAGYRGWLWWEERRAAQAGDRYVAALEALAEGDREEGAAALDAIAEGGDAGYAALARLKLAGESAAAGDKEAALAAYDALAADSSLPQSLRDLARIKAALVALDMGEEAGAVERAEPLNAPGDPWRHAAREVLGTAAYASGDLQTAREYFTSIQEDAETPPDIWQRSGMMIALIDGQLAGPVAETDAGAEPNADGKSDAGAENDGAESDAGAEVDAPGMQDAPAPQVAPDTEGQ
jgi:hypothetical protein